MVSSGLKYYFVFHQITDFSLPVLKAGNLSKSRTSNKKHEMTIKSKKIP